MQSRLQTRSATQTGETICAPASPCASAASEHIRVGGRDFTANAVADFEPDDLARSFERPEQVLNDPTAIVVKRGRSALVARIDLPTGGGTRVAYKRCGSRTWARRLVRGMRRSAAQRNFLLGHRLLRLGIATPRPLIAVSPRWHNLLAPSFLATEWIDDAVPFDAFARIANLWAPARRRAAFNDTARGLGRLIGTLHKHGFAHRDLKSGNLLVRERRGQVEVFLVDLDGASRLRLRTGTRRSKNLARLHAASQHLASVTPSVRCRFVQTYLATLGKSADWKAVWRRLGETSKIPTRPRPPRTAD